MSEEAHPFAPRREKGGASARALIFTFRGWRQQSIQSQIHRRHSVMVGPTAGESQKSPHACARLIVKPLNILSQLRTIRFRQSCTTELEGFFHRRNQFVLAIAPFQYLPFGLRDATNIGTEVIVSLDYMPR